MVDREELDDCCPECDGTGCPSCQWAEIMSRLDSEADIADLNFND